MVKNFIIIAFRNLYRNKVYSAVNIIGLVMGITCTTVLMLYVLDELSYDSFYSNPDNTYRVYVRMNINGEESVNGKVSAAMAEALESSFSEIERAVRLGYFGNQNLSYKEKSFREWSIYGADPDYFEIAPLNFIFGDSKSALTEPNSIVISQNAAIKYFGDENPIGKIIKSEQYGAYLVTGVFENYPRNSHFKADYLVSMSTYPDSKEHDWLNLNYYTFTVLKEGVDPESFELKIQELVNGEFSSQIEKALGVPVSVLLSEGNEYSYHLQPLSHIYLHSARTYGIDVNSEWGEIKIGDITRVYIFSAIALFILLIAIINYMNLSTARAEKRSKEIGIRKTLGSTRSELIWQFLSESVLIVSVAVAISLVIVEFALPLINSSTDNVLKLAYFENIYVIPSIIVFILVLGLLAGSYPALYLSLLNPFQTIKSSRPLRKNKLYTKLVILQFAISITLIISMMIMNEQLKFVQNKSLGFKKEHLISISINNNKKENIDNIKNELLKNSSILSVTHSGLLFQTGIPGNGYILDKSSDNTPTLCQHINTDYDFLKTFEIQLENGRFFSRKFSSDDSNVLINNAAAKKFGDKELIGRELIKIIAEGEQKKHRIIGIMKDFNYESLHQVVRPLVIHLGDPTRNTSMLTIRISSDDIFNTIEKIKKVFNNFSNIESVNVQFLENNLQRLYESENKARSLVSIFSLLALLIASLGLFGLATFMAEQKVKEIGIRKTIGASIPQIVFLLSKDFSKLVLVSNVIAWPVAYYFMKEWLQDFAYRVDIYPGAFILAGSVTFLFAMAIIGFNIVKASLANPVDSLRNE